MNNKFLKTSLLFLCSLLLVGFVVFRIRNNSKLNSSPPSRAFENQSNNILQKLEKNKERWIENITKDPQKASKSFKQDVNMLSLDKQHVAAHLFGALLFQIKGTDAVTVCDGSFNFGCYHGFFGEAVSKHDLVIVPVLDAACTKTAEKGACQHGIGHAILAHFGKNERIDEALAVCTTLKKYGPYGGCTNGVFMEYNFFTMRNPTGSPRKLTKNNIQTPCTLVSKRFQESCYFFQPQWWRLVLNSNYLKMGQLCQALSDENLARACFIGIGNIAGPSSKFKMDKSFASCQKMPTPQAQAYCQIGLANIFATEPAFKKFANEACKGLSGSEKKACNKRNILFKKTTNTL